MTPRPIYRWKTFWLGLLVTCFLTWAWHDSMRSNSRVVWSPAYAANGGGGISLGRLSSRGIAPGSPVLWGRDVPAFKIASPLFAAPLALRGGGVASFDSDAAEAIYFAPSYRESMIAFMRCQPGKDGLLFIPHWLVLLAFALPWSTFLIWRTRRQRKLIS